MMKKFITTSIIALMTVFCYAPGSNTVMIFESKPIQVPDKLILAIMRYESKNNPLAYNPSEDACGILQLRGIMIDEVNRIMKLQNNPERYTLQDRWDSLKSVRIYYTVQTFHNPGYNHKKAAYLWNGGSTKPNKSTINYYNQIKKLL